jgi:outer membrane protein OmpA-like peptidoglycan-associated protein
LSILFTDTTLARGVVDKSYSDFVEAKTLRGTIFSGSSVSYLLAGLLPAGLSFNSSSGYLAGAILKGVAPGIYKLQVSAIAKDYPTQTYPFDFEVLPATKSVVMTLVNTVLFDSGKSLLTSASKTSLNKMINDLNESGFKNVAINGFTDAVSGQSHSIVSLARADAVKRYVLARTDGVKVISTGKGLAPSSKNSTKAMQVSRKAEIWMG